MTTQVLSPPMAPARATRASGLISVGVPIWLDGVAAAALALVPFWWHIPLVAPDGPTDVTAVFDTVAVYPSDVCLGVLALGGLGLLVARRQRRAWPLTWVAVGLAGLAVAALLSALAASVPVLAAGLAGHLALLGLAWMAVAITPISARWLAVGAVASGCVQAALAIAQFANQRPLVPPRLGLPWLPSADITASGAPVVLDGSGERLLRAFGTFPHPNILGGYLALALVLLPLLVTSRRGGWLAVLPGLLLAAGLVVSFSRAAWLAVAIGWGVWWLARLRRPGGAAPPWTPRLMLLGAGLGVALVVLALSPVGELVAVRLSPRPANDLERGSIEQRLALDRHALTLIKRHPGLGVGAGNFGEASLEEGLQAVFGEPAHSVPLLVAAETGLPGLLAGACLVFGLFVFGRRDPRRAGPALAACCAIGVLMLLDHYLWTMAPARVIAWAPLAVVAATGGRMAR
jgi:O-antigen ligase/polysaccharide polymerase Wzy-like membrane protein